MAVIPLVPKTNMVDVGKLISLGNLLVKKVHVRCALNYVRDFDSVLHIWSRLHNKNYLPRTHSLSHFPLQRQHTLTLSFLTSRDSTLSLSLST